MSITLWQAEQEEAEWRCRNACSSIDFRLLEEGEENHLGGLTQGKRPGAGEPQ